MTRRAAPSLVAVYADESCLGNGREGDNPGGAGGLMEVLRPRSRALMRYDFWLSEPGTTNNRMALRSALLALDIVSRLRAPHDVVFTSDSRYLVDGMSQWVHDWIRRGWRRKGGTIENLALWQSLADAARGLSIQWRWVRGHEGHAQNEYANHLATRAAARQDAALEPRPSEFDEWLAARQARGMHTETPDPFPVRASFCPARPLPVAAAGSLF